LNPELDSQIERAEPDRWLASRFIADAAARADVIALYAFDHELGRVRLATSNPLMGEIRLTWWREVLDEIFELRPVRHHPTAQALAEVVTRHRLPRAPLEGLIDVRYEELGGRTPEGEEAIAWADSVGGGSMWLAALILDRETPALATGAAGRLFGLGRLGAPAAQLAAVDKSSGRPSTASKRARRRRPFGGSSATFGRGRAGTRASSRASSACRSAVRTRPARRAETRNHHLSLSFIKTLQVSPYFSKTCATCNR